MWNNKGWQRTEKSGGNEREKRVEETKGKIREGKVPRNEDEWYLEKKGRNCFHREEEEKIYERQQKIERKTKKRLQKQT